MTAPSRFTIEFEIPTWWTSEQALAVYDLLHQLREKIWNHYQLQLLQLLPELYGPSSNDELDIDLDDLPF
jgi:hypothetical protein